MNILDLAEKHVDLKRVASTKGGEYAGPCPGCGGDDRFRVCRQKRTVRAPGGAAVAAKVATGFNS
jgi:hypothetical protein